MQVVVNHQLIKKNARIGKLATLIGVIGLAAGFLMSWQMSDPGKTTDWAVVAFSYAALIVSLLALTIGRHHMARWSRRPRADEVLAESLPGFDPRSYLFSYLPTMPVEHMLISRRGVLVIVAKHVFGEVRNQGRRWHRKTGLAQIFGGYAEGSLGNPGAEATQGVALVRHRLAAAFGNEGEGIPVSAVIVFTDSRAKVNVEDPAVPVAAPGQQLRDFVRALPGEGKLAPEKVDQMADLFAPNRQYYAKPAELPKKKTPGRLKRKMRPADAATDVSKMGRNRAERRMK